MELHFAKLHGLGNDFVLIDDFSSEINLTVPQVKLMCDRHFGIGADGVILVRPSKNPSCTAYMHYINSDGTLAQMCGNGVRCFAKFLVDRGFVDAGAGKFVADTMAGPRAITFSTNAEGKLLDATVDMGKPIFEPAEIPVSADANKTSNSGISFVGDIPIESPWGTFNFTCVSMGNPHAICFISNFNELPDEVFSNASNKCLSNFDVARVGAFFESHEVFPEKTNVEFISVESENSLHMRVYERGCAETLACGTGACATCVAAAITGRASRKASVHLRGGTLKIEWCENGSVKMTGPAAEAYQGTINVQRKANICAKGCAYSHFLSNLSAHMPYAAKVSCMKFCQFSF